MTALLKAVRTKLQSALSVDSKFCEIDPQARPTPMMGYWKISLGPSAVRTVHTSPKFICRSYGIHVNVSKRIGEVPRDRRNYSYLNEVNALEKICERIIPIVHSYAITTEANLTITEGEKFYKPFYYQGTNEPEMVDGSWNDSVSDDKNIFLLQRLRFDGAELVQRIDDLAAQTY